MNQEYTSKWEEIRSHWVNGNRKDAKALITEGSKENVLKTILEAVTDYYDSTGNHTSNGALIDLIEILRTI